MRTFLLIHPGTQYATRLAEQLLEKNIPFVFVTSLVVSTKDWFYPFLPTFIRKKMAARTVVNIPPHQLHRIIRFELQFIWKKWIEKKAFSEEDFFNRNLEFQKAIPSSLLKGADIVIGYDTSSIYLINQCRELGKKFILDVSIGHPLAKASIFQQIATQYPHWKDAVHQKANHLLEHELQEIQLADAIVVPSSFVKSTYLSQGCKESSIHVNPFGVNLQYFQPSQQKKLSNPIRFVFLGIKNARKGVPFLIDVWKNLNLSPKVATLNIAGPEKIPNDIVLPKGIEEWGFVNPTDRAHYFSKGDVFVFPSFFEGLAQVQLEAAAAGLPVIGTNHSGAEEFVQNGVNGFVIEAGNMEQLQQAILYFIQHPDEIRTMGEQARLAALQFSWDAYGERWKRILDTV